MGSARELDEERHDHRRPTPQRTLSISGPTMPNAISTSTAPTTLAAATTAMQTSTRRLTMSVSNLLTAATAPRPSLVRTDSASGSGGSKRRIGPVASSTGGPLVRTNSASGGSMSRRQQAAADKQLAIKMRYSNKSNKSNKSARHDHEDDDNDDQLYKREKAEVEVEELASLADKSSHDNVTRLGSMASTHKQMSNSKLPTTTTTNSKPKKPQRVEWTIAHDATRLTAAPPPSSPSPSKLRVQWASPTGLLGRQGIHGSSNYRLASWLGVLTIHAVCTALYSCLAVAHTKLPRTQLSTTLTRYSNAMLRFTSCSTAIAVIAALLAFLHGAVTLRMVRQSLACRQLMYYAPNYFSAARSDQIVPFAASVRALTGVAPTNPRARRLSGGSIAKSIVFKTWWVLQELLWARRDLVELNNTAPSERMYRATVVCQTIAHVCEAVEMSRLVGSSWLHHAHVALIVVNAWLPFVLTMLRNTQTIVWHSHRIASLVSSILLDAFGTLAIPIVMVHWSTMTDYKITHATEDTTSFYHWLVQTLLHVQFLLAMNALSLVVRLLLGLHLLSSLNALKSLLESVTSSRPPIPSTERSISGSPTKTMARHNKLIKIKPGTRTTLVLETLLVIGGVLTLAGHFTASRVSGDSSAASRHCPVPVRPWFTNTLSCPLVELNCATTPALVAVQATGSTLETVLSQIDPHSVRHVLIQFCAQVEIPRVIRDLPQLVTLTIAHSTLQSWPASAALSQQSHPAMCRVAIVNTTMAELPDGLLALEFPMALNEIALRGTNLSSLPSSIHERWPHVETLLLDHSSALDVVPSGVLRMASLKELSLIGNKITVLPKELLEMATLEKLWLDGNPIAALPDDVQLSSSSRLELLALDSTQLRTLPSWATSRPSLVKLLGNTPYCDASLQEGEWTALGVNCTKLSHSDEY